MADAQEWTGREGFRPGDPKKVADEMYREVRASAAKSRLTWMPEEMQVTAATDEKTRHLLEDGKVGEFRPKLPYVLINKKYFIQNSRVLNRGGQPIEVESISDKAIDADGRSERSLVQEALANFKDSALNADPKLCRECAAFRADDYQTMVKHLFKEHPEQFATLMKEVAPELPDAPPEPKKPGKLACACGYSTDVQAEWLTHVKTHKAIATAE